MLLCVGMSTWLVGLPLTCYDPQSFLTALNLCNPCNSFLCSQAVLAEKVGMHTTLSAGTV